MTTAKNYVQHLNASATDLDDLSLILRHLPLASIKTFINEQIEEMSAETFNKIYFNQASIEETLPCDVIQKILSYDGFYHSKSISKQFKFLSEQNETNYFTQSYGSINTDTNQEEIMDIYDVVIDSKRKNLHQIEKRHGFAGPLSLNDALLTLVDGSRLFVHKGIYETSFVNLDRNVHIIGIAPNVVFKSRQNVLFLISKNDEKCKMTFENIAFVGPRCGFIFQSGAKCDITFRNCHFEGFNSVDGTAICLHKRSLERLEVDGCTFTDASCAIHIESRIDVIIKYCLFRRCGQIRIRSGVFCNDHSIVLLPNRIGTNFEWIGNTFEDE